MLFLSTLASSQPAPKTLSFEVVSVKLHEGPMPRIGVSTSGDRLQADATNVWGLTLFAYNVKNDLLARRPSGRRLRHDVVKAVTPGRPLQAPFPPRVTPLFSIVPSATRLGPSCKWNMSPTSNSWCDPQHQNAISTSSSSPRGISPGESTKAAPWKGPPLTKKSGL